MRLWDCVAQGDAHHGGELRGRNAHIPIADLGQGSTLGSNLESLRGRSVVLATREQLATALALLELDGVAGRVVLCTPDLSAAALQGVAERAGAEAVVLDSAASVSVPCGLTRVLMTDTPVPPAPTRRLTETTEWILLTSGTIGAPKLVVHTLDTLAGRLPGRAPSADRVVWSTFYDIRRYGGLQIYLRAVLGGVPLVVGSLSESIPEFLDRAAAAGVTHLSGTPSHWRQALRSGAAANFQPGYVRLSGEVADQPLLDHLRVAFPRSRIAHAFASTEAGVAFEVDDGLAGFPAGFIGQPGPVQLKVANGTLHIRSPGNALRYQGDAHRMAGDDGYVDTGDMVEKVDGRYHFRGRRGGIINVGGLKVYPEEVEAVLNAHPRVRLSRVSARRSPVTGSVVVADIVLSEAPDSARAEIEQTVKSELLNTCRRTLEAHKVPVTLRFVADLEVTAAGKLERAHA